MSDLPPSDIPKNLQRFQKIVHDNKADFVSFAVFPFVKEDTVKDVFFAVFGEWSSRSKVSIVRTTSLHEMSLLI